MIHIFLQFNIYIVYVRFSELQINYQDYKDLTNYVSLIVGKRVHISQVYTSFLSLSNYTLYFTTYAIISIHMHRYLRGYIKEIRMPIY